jgi:hypothetical protein
LIYIVNDSGPRTDIWGTPAETMQSEEDELFINTLCCRSCRDHDLKELDEWSKKWLMSFNPDKTEIMLFSNTDIPEFNFTFNGRTIPITNSHKHLGQVATDRVY